MSGMREGIRKTSASYQKMKSILRTPNRKYTDDPVKIAAGTHMSPPPGLDFFAEPVPQAPATAPPQKRVAFSSSTLAKISHDELGKSPSPMKFRGGSEVPAGSVLYPKLQPDVAYPDLPEGEEATPGSAVRRLTFGEAPTGSAPEFSFQSDKTIKFGPSSIRMVVPSNASSVADAKKRKLEPTEETSDKENNEPPAEEEGRSPNKKARMAAPEPTRTPSKVPSKIPSMTPSSVSKLPRRTPNRGASISKSRLAFLSTPKRAKH